MNMDPASVRERITDRTRAIVCGHIAGIPCEMDEIMAIAAERELWVIEDCAQSHDAIYDGRKCGSIGHMGCFSLMSGKHTTAGGQGGMVVTDDEELYWNAKRFADRGKPFNSEVGSNLFLGLNYRMTELEACVGRVQLQKMHGIAEARRGFVRRLESEIADLQTVKVCWYPEKAEPAWWFGLMRIYPEKLTVDKPTFAAAVAAEGVPMAAGYGAVATRAHWLQEQRAFGRESHFPWDTLWDGDWQAALSVPGAEAADANHMRFSVHECMTEREALDMAAALRKVEEAYIT
ncbi:MAG TPA: DegT/DnrJ/EryC1/StrS family aminotransferase, partial [Armatimonadota bacterium]|nr:DegT/DnrJ/EryC1/StrS family aminotransferase [Armatimonadota bacterium]